MNDVSSSKTLANKCEVLRSLLTLPDSICHRETSDAFQAMDLQFARMLLGGGRPLGQHDSFKESRQIYEDVLLKSEEGRRLCLAAEVDRLQQVAQSHGDIEQAGPFGIGEMVFPVIVRGHVVHLVESGPYRTTPLSPKELEEIAFLGGVPIATAQAAAAALPILNEGALDSLCDALRQARDTAASALHEHIRAGELNASYLQAERLNSLGTLAEGMAHHFNNLMTVVLGYSSLLLDQDEQDEDRTEMLRKIAETAQRGRRFTEEVLGMAAKLGDEKVQAISVHDRVTGVLGLLGGNLGRNCTIESRLEAEHDLVAGPPGVLHQVIFNLISNGLQSMPHGGTLTIATRTMPKETGEPERIHLHIHDSGDTPVSRTSKRSHARQTILEQDLGPKLASVLGMIAHLDGSLKVTADAQSGTSVDIHLPVCTDPDDLPVTREVRKRLAPSRIWVVDDDPVVRDMCSRVLSEEGHEVAVVENGDDLRKRMLNDDTEKPELLIYDFSMPDVPGRELVAWLREDQNNRIPIVLISGFQVDHPEIKASLKFRKTFLLNKPFTFRDMADQVTVALGETLIGE